MVCKYWRRVYWGGGGYGMPVLEEGEGGYMVCQYWRRVWGDMVCQY